MTLQGCMYSGLVLHVCGTSSQRVEFGHKFGHSICYAIVFCAKVLMHTHTVSLNLCRRLGEYSFDQQMTMMTV